MELEDEMGGNHKIVKMRDLEGSESKSRFDFPPKKGNWVVLYLKIATKV